MLSGKKLIYLSEQALNGIYRDIFDSYVDKDNYKYLLKPEYFFSTYLSKYLVESIEQNDYFLRFELTYKEILLFLIEHDHNRAFSSDNAIKVLYTLLKKKKKSIEESNHINSFFTSFKGRNSGSIDISILKKSFNGKIDGLPYILLELKTDSNRMDAIKKDIQRIADFIVWNINSNKGNLNTLKEGYSIIVGNKKHLKKIELCYKQIIENYDSAYFSSEIIQKTIQIIDPTFDPTPGENPTRIVSEIGCTVISFVRK
ncbi:hypothetical protein JNG78_04430 [Proteus mirabilis]|uniref:hypothetical protein n=1 Tax=Proteus mirabilis TaxID=584 RepID=UPI001FAC700B|nr:hypothetical protein [Proteus mirabilis]MCI9726965.1 hypothetical protein [Proteus mirabilis]MCI9730723.1 hypothetical protein [Proteus mirabilis]MCI9734477.1 hypothetical protein [Proteus mirabilis]MCI9755268.1 hypothetical protein [Proteus mirabilis]MCI9759026.1 hypothetical protein [Proteus mirabilis]